MIKKSITVESPGGEGKKRLLYIVNPISGRGRQGALESLLDKYKDDHRITCDIKYTESAGHAAQISKNNCRQYDALIAVGGDGSINEVAQGLIDTDTALGVIPNGSGNGFARHLKIPMKMEKAVETIHRFHTTRIDTAEVNGHPYVNVAGIGFDALIAHKFAAFGKRGLLSYAKITVSELYRFKPLNVRVVTNGEEQDVRVFLISIANGSQFGNNAVIAPDASMQDGQLNAVLMNRFPYTSVPALAGRLFTKTLDRSKYIATCTARHIILEKKGKILAHLDSEPYTFHDKVEIRVRPNSLKVIVPC
jgi:YegS/Rv2252/BmrU family lipid kinase